MYSINIDSKVKTNISKNVMMYLALNLDLKSLLNLCLTNKKFLLRELDARLTALSPDAILDRGYSITRTIPDAVIVRNPQQVEIGQDLEVMVAKGSLICSVKRKQYYGKTDI